MKKDKGAKKGADKKPMPAKATIGHNSNGQKIPGLIKVVDELLHIGEQKKAMGKAERDLRNKAKTEFGILSGPLAHELRLRKMDGDVRVQFESNHSDLKVALGYQPELDFAGGVPTQASVKAQPPEAEMPSNVKPLYSVKDEDDETSNPDTTAKSGGVIEREG